MPRFYPDMFQMSALFSTLYPPPCTAESGCARPCRPRQTRGAVWDFSFGSVQCPDIIRHTAFNRLVALTASGATLRHRLAALSGSRPIMDALFTGSFRIIFRWHYSPSSTKTGCPSIFASSCSVNGSVMLSRRLKAGSAGSIGIASDLYR